MKQSFESYVRGGGGFVSVHAADNAFPKWAAFNEMITEVKERNHTIAEKTAEYESLLRNVLPEAVADRIGPIWGFGDGQELRNMFVRTPQSKEHG